MFTGNTIRKLSEYAACSENCFDVFLSENEDKFSSLLPEQIKFLIQAREKCVKLNEVVSFTKEELYNSVNEGYVSLDGEFAGLYNDFLIAESFFE